MKSQLKKAIADLHATEMSLQALFNENAEMLQKLKIKDDMWTDTAHWKYTKALEGIFNAKKTLNKIYDSIPKAKK